MPQKERPAEAGQKVGAPLLAGINLLTHRKPLNPQLSVRSLGLAVGRRRPIFQAMLRPAPYLSKKLTRPLPTKDRGVLRTVKDARTYMMALSKHRETSAQWQRAAAMLLEQADVTDLSSHVQLALFYDGKLDLAALSEPL